MNKDQVLDAIIISRKAFHQNLPSCVQIAFVPQGDVSHNGKI